MKYIRTKTFITELEDWMEVDDETLKIGSVKYKIIAQAETIEELCDEFVLDHPLFANNCKNLYHSFEKAKNGIKKRSGYAYDIFSFEIYGAIWTDKGLIYVAKMNEKGELELL